MEEMNYNIDPENEVSYGTSCKGKEVMIVNDREIFHKKYSGKRLINNIFKIGWICKNKHNCNGTLVSIRDVVDLDGTDYNIVRKNEHSIHCSISRTDVVVLKHLNSLMEQCKEPGVNQQIVYEAVKISVEIHYPNESHAFPSYDSLRSIMSRFSKKHRPRDPILETIETFDIPVEYRTTLGENGVNFIIHRICIPNPQQHKVI
jgi:hypothetical protein